MSTKEKPSRITKAFSITPEAWAFLEAEAEKRLRSPSNMIEVLIQAEKSRVEAADDTK